MSDPNSANNRYSLKFTGWVMGKSDNSCNLSFGGVGGQGSLLSSCLQMREPLPSLGREERRHETSKGWRSSIWAPWPSYPRLPIQPVHFYFVSLMVGTRKSSPYLLYNHFPILPHHVSTKLDFPVSQKHPKLGLGNFLKLECLFSIFLYLSNSYPLFKFNLISHI